MIFPNHENEIAQAEALHGKPFAKYWIHHGLITVNSQKMSKSLGNFITVQDILKKYTVDELKMFFLFSHYASNADFTDEKMEDAKKALQKFDVLFWKAHELLKGKTGVPASSVEFVEKHKAEFLAAMDDDFNTPRALAALFDLINDINKFIAQESGWPDYLPTVYKAVDTLESLARDIFGLFSNETDKDLDGGLKKLVEERKAARANKDFKRSDELRDLLKDKGVIVEDTKQGQTWRWA